MLEIRAKLVLMSIVVALSACLADGATLSPATRPTVYRAWMPKGFHAVRDIPYAPRASKSQTLDVYVPDVATAPRPLMVWIHGGAWYGGDKAAPPGMGLLTRGYVVASINYRLSSEAVFPAQIFDCKAAVRFLRGHAREFGIDPNRIGIWGESAGGQLASLMGATNGRRDYEGTEGNLNVSSQVEAVCDWFGPSDFLQANDVTTGAGTTAVKQLFGGLISAHVEAARFASPAQQVTQGNLPSFLIMHGDQDRLVPEHQSEVLYQKLKIAGANVQLVVISHAGHGYGWFTSRSDLTMVYDFFDRCLHPARVRASIATTRPAA
jgi:acetyl esterase/lipase